MSAIDPYTKDHKQPTLGALRRVWPADVPFLGLGGGRVVVATAFREVDANECLGQTLAKNSVAAGDSADLAALLPGYLGVLSYDQFLYDQLPSMTRPLNMAPHRFFRVDKAVSFGDTSGAPRILGQESGKNDVVLRDEDVRRLVDAARCVPATGASKGLELRPASSDASYISAARRVLSDIRDGRFYQLNLLRYFELLDEVNMDLLAARLDVLGGPFASWVDVPDLRLVSFSPERFVHLVRDQNGTWLETAPVKGTVSRSSDPDADAALAHDLAASPKDRAELAMIVDLMRNDLARVAVRGSVAVPEPQRVLTVPTVHHLEARIRARPRPGLTLGELFQALSPGGSITGAPKREVMRAVRELEGRDRGYFMGHVFCAADSGGFDSSILIRTLVKQGGNPYEFAAGSGIVMRSDPEAERREINAKSRVLSEALPKIGE